MYAQYILDACYLRAESNYSDLEWKDYMTLKIIIIVTQHLYRPSYHLIVILSYTATFFLIALVWWSKIQNYMYHDYFRGTFFCDLLGLWQVTFLCWSLRCMYYRNFQYADKYG